MYPHLPTVAPDICKMRAIILLKGHKVTHGKCHNYTLVPFGCNVLKLLSLLCGRRCLPSLFFKAFKAVQPCMHKSPPLHSHTHHTTTWTCDSFNKKTENRCKAHPITIVQYFALPFAVWLEKSLVNIIQFLKLQPVLLSSVHTDKQ